MVETTAEANALADAVVNCSSGLFDVEWRGDVVVEKAIYLADGSALTINGVGANAGMDGQVSGSPSASDARLRVTLLRWEGLERSLAIASSVTPSAMTYRG